MLMKIALPFVSVSLLAFAAVHVIQTAGETPLETPPRQPPQASFDRAVAATGIVEPRGGFVHVGAPEHGLVARVCVEAGDRVAKDTPLFQLDDRHLQAELAAQHAAVEVAKAELARVEQSARSDEVAAADAHIAEAEARLTGRRDHLERVLRTFERQASSAGEVARSRSEVKEAEAQLACAQAAKRLLLEGAAEENRAAARATVELAVARREQVATEIERLTVRAPFDARILRVDVRLTQAVGPTDPQPLMVLARDGACELRVDIHEDELANFDPRAAAHALPSGDSEPIPLELVRIEPYVAPQSSDAGPHDTVDARVLQAIYALPASSPSAARLYPGQQIDVFISAMDDDAHQPEAYADASG